MIRMFMQDFSLSLSNSVGKEGFRMDKIKKLDNLYEKSENVGLEAKRLIATQEELTINLMNEYRVVAEWYINKGTNNSDIYSRDYNKILVARERNRDDGAYLWNPNDHSIEYYDLDSYGEGIPTMLKEILGNRYFEEIVRNIRELDHSMEDDF